MKQLIFTLVLFITFTSTVFAQTSQETPTETINVLIILDCSNSMNEVIGKDTKIEIAREVILEFIKQLPDNIHVGLQVYGHNSQDNCMDTDLLIPIAKPETSVFKKELNQLTPQGMTLMMTALHSGMNELSKQTGKGLVLLISDGQESCGRKPCQEIFNLTKKTGFKKLKVFTVGFATGEDATHELLCIARGTGGEYYAANDRKAMIKGLNEAIQLMLIGGDVTLELLGSDGSQMYVPVQAKHLDTPEKSRNLNSGFATLLFPGNYEFISDTQPPVYHKDKVVSKESQLIKMGGFGQMLVELQATKEGISEQVPVKVIDIQTGESIKTAFANEITEIPSGTYDLLIQSKPPVTKENVEIQAGILNRVMLGTYGILRVELVDGIGEPWRDVVVEVKNEATGQVIDYYNTWQEVELPSGSYSLLMKTVQPIKKTGVTVGAGELTAVKIDNLGTMLLIAKNDSGIEIEEQVKLGDKNGKLLSFIKTGYVYHLLEGIYTISPASRFQFPKQVVKIEKGKEIKVELATKKK